MNHEAVTIMQSDIDAYARVSGDFNPIHVDPDVARTTPYGSTLAHGTISSALITRRLLGENGPGGFIKKLSLRFVAPIRSGDTLQAHVEPVSENAAGAAPDEQTYKVSTSNQANETVSVGDAVVARSKS